VTYTMLLTRKAQKDMARLKQAGLENKARALLAEEPLRAPPACEKLAGDLKECCSRRIDLQHRLAYMVNESQKTVKVLSMWLRYKD
jgi:toxin YoeB